MKKQITKRHTESFKMQVVREYEAGASGHSLQQKYGISGSLTIKGWVNKYSHEGYRSELLYIQSAEDQVEFKAMQTRIHELEHVLSETVLENRMLKTTLAVAGQALNIDLKKTFGSQS